jgi:hypothetical protein
MAIQYLSSINLGKLELQNARIHNLATAPSSPVAGQIYYDTTTLTMYFYRVDPVTPANSGWVDIKGDIQEVIAGNGLTGGGDGGSITLNVGAGTGITVNADTVQLDITNTRNTDHTGLNVTAGDGLTGGGELTAGVTLNVVATTDAGIEVTADAIRFKNYANLTQYNVMMWGPGGQLTNAPIVRTVNQANEEIITIQGNLIVTGTTTSVNSNEVNIGDSIIKLNSDATGTATQNAGFEVERGDDTNVSFLWDESADRFTTVDQKFHVGSVETIVPGTDDFFYVYDNAIGETGEIKKATFDSIASLLGSPKHFSLDPAQTGVVSKSGNTYTVTHNFGTKAVMAQVIQYSTQETVMVDVARPTVNTVTVAFASAVTDNAYYIILTPSRRTGDVVGGSEQGDAPSA